MAEEALRPIAVTPVRALLLGLGTCIALVLFTYSYTVSASDAAALEKRLEGLASKHVSISLPYTSGPYSTLSPEHVEAIRRIDGVVDVAHYAVSNSSFYCAQCRVSPEEFMPKYGRLKVISISGSPEVLGLQELSETTAADSMAHYSGTSGNLRDFSRGQTLTVDGRDIVLAGSVGQSIVDPSSTDGVVRFTDNDSVDLTVPGRIVVETAPGAPDDVAGLVASLVDPVNPDLVSPSYADDADSLRRDVAVAVDRIIVIVVAALLIVSGVGVGLASFAKVVERVRFIGLLRAIGCSDSVIVVQQSLESAAIGFVASVVGITVGLLVSSFKVAVELHVPVALLGSAAIGAVLVHALAAVGPAVYATRVSPIDAIRSQ